MEGPSCDLPKVPEPCGASLGIAGVGMQSRIPSTMLLYENRDDEAEGGFSVFACEQYGLACATYHRPVFVIVPA